MTDLYSLVVKGDLAAVKMCLQRGEDVDTTGGKDKQTALMAAVEKNNTDIAKLLIKYNANVNGVDRTGKTPLMWAAGSKHPDMTTRLLKKKAFINAVDKWKRTVLHWCAMSGDDVSAQILIKAGAKVDVRTSGLQTPLMLATGNKNPNVTALLLNNGADVNAVNKHNNTALHWCAKSGDVLSALALIQAGALVNASTSDQWTPLTLAAKENHVEVVKQLLVALSQKDIENVNGETALDLALKGEHTETSRVLTGDVSADPAILFWGRLDMSNQELNRCQSTLPSDFNCTVLLLNNNQLTNCSLTKQFSTLTTVKICSNQLTEIDGFPNTVTFLDASDNQIIFVKSVPSSLNNCNLTKNPITTFESECFESNNLTSVLKKALTSTQISKLIQPPPEIFKRGHNTIKKYFKDIRLSRVIESSTAKCVITGETTAGKTSLVKSLLSNQPFLTDIQDRTQVLDVATWNFSDGCSMEMYDTGGHTIYDVTSTFFANANSIILVVHDLASPPSINRTMEVLRRNLYHHPQNRTTFVLTHIDVLDKDEIARRKEEFQKEIQQLFSQEIASLRLVEKDIETDYVTDKDPLKTNENELGNITDLINMYQDQLENSQYFTISSKTMAGIPQLRAFLISKIMKSRVKIPSKWIICYQTLHTTDKLFYTTAEYEECYFKTYKGIRKLTPNFSKKADASTCLTYFSDVGLVLTFPDHPSLKDYVFHKNEFLVSLFKSVFDHHMERDTNYSRDDYLIAKFDESEFRDTMTDFMENGILSHKLLRYMWRKYDLKQEDELALAGALKLFDIFFEVESSDHDLQNLKYFIPWLVKSKTAPLKITSPRLLNHKLIRLKLQYTFQNKIPVNVAEQMFVRLQKFAVHHQYQGERYAWEDGLHITLGSLELAVIRHQPHIYLLVTGELTDLDKIWTSFRDIYTEQKSIVKPWKGVIIRRDVICFHCMLKSIDEPHKWSVKTVFPDNTSKAVPKARCPKSEELIPAALTHPLTGDASSKAEQTQQVVEYLKNHWLGMFSTLTDIMHPHPVIIQLQSMMLLTSDDIGELNSLSVPKKVKYLVEKLLLGDTDHRENLRQALRKTDYHTNVTLAKALAGKHSPGDYTALPELLTDEEKQQILSASKDFKNYLPEAFIKYLYEDNTLDGDHMDLIKAIPAARGKGKYLLDNVLVRGTYETVYRFRKASEKAERKEIVGITEFLELLPYRPDWKQDTDE